MSPVSGSELPAPLRVTVAPAATDWSDPASATGARLAPAGETVTVTVSVALAVPSLTVRVKTNAVLVVTVGAVKVGEAVVPSVRVTAGVPEV